jgi:HlyD family secretion protein
MTEPVLPVASTPPTVPAVAPAATVATEPAAGLTALLGITATAAWYRRPWLWAGVAALVLLAAGSAWWLHLRAVAAEPTYTAAPVARGDITLSVTANGTIQPTRSINIGSELSGTVLKVNVDVNDIIRKGQVLVVLDPAKFQDQVSSSRAAVAAAQALVAQTVATLAESRATLARLEDVARASGGKVPAKTELDTARATLGRAVGAADSAAAGVKQAQAQLATDLINLSKSSIVAPADGMVLTRAVDPGNAVAASLQAVTLFTVAEDLQKVRVWVYVDEADVGQVKLGQAATFTVSAYPTRSFPARITRVGFGSTITDNVVTYLTYLDVDNNDLSLRPGMTATSTIVAAQRKDVLLVPNAALRYTPTAAAAAAKKSLASGISFGRPTSESTRKGAADTASTAAARQVWVLPGDGKDPSATPVAVAVVPGISDGHMTEIVGGDLKAGMQVVTAQKTAASK